MLRSQDRQTNITNLTKRIKFFDENETCPVCDQTLSDSHKSHVLETIEGERRTHKSSLKQIGSEGTIVEKEIKETGRLLESLRSKVSELSQNNVKITGLTKQIEEYQSYLEKDVSADLDSAKSDLKSLNDKFDLKDLSMGMSHDYLKALKYKATFLRIGSKIFGNRN